MIAYSRYLVLSLTTWRLDIMKEPTKYVLADGTRLWVQPVINNRFALITLEPHDGAHPSIEYFANRKLANEALHTILETDAHN